MRAHLLLAATIFAMTVVPALSQPLDNVESRLFKTKDFKLTGGTVLPELVLAYETYGRLAPDGRNVVLLTHGYTSSHHAAGRYGATGAPLGLKAGDVGSWDKLIGPGKAIDTDKLYVVSSNMLGSSYGSTSPRSTNPATGKPYGPDFPRIVVADIVNAQKAMLDQLGVKHLVAVVGGSYGGFQAFQWAVSYPGHMDGVVPVITAPSSTTTPKATQKLAERLAKDPNWNGGWYYDKGGITQTMAALRVETLKNYGIEAQLRPKHPAPKDLEAAIQKAAEPWVQAFDGHSLIVLRRALEGFDTTRDFGKIKARMLYVISRTDKLFPPSIVPDVMAKLKAAGVDARYFEIDSELGHMAPGPDAEKWSPALKAFMAGLMPKT